MIMKTRERFWLAINGSSVAMCAFPLKYPFYVYPRPQGVVGFKTEEEARKWQNILLTCPASELEGHIRTLLGRKDVVNIPMKNSDPQTDGQTIWSQKPI